MRLAKLLLPGLLVFGIAACSGTSENDNQFDALNPTMETAYVFENIIQLTVDDSDPDNLKILIEEDQGPYKNDTTFVSHFIADVSGFILRGGNEYSKIEFIGYYRDYDDLKNPNEVAVSFTVNKEAIDALYNEEIEYLDFYNHLTDLYINPKLKYDEERYKVQANEPIQGIEIISDRQS